MNYIFYIMMIISCTFFPIHSMEFWKKIWQTSFKHTNLRVRQGSSGAISLTPTETHIPTIYTKGLVGCTACVLYARSENKGNIILTHYPDGDSYKQHLIELKKQIQLLTAQQKIKTVRLLVVTPKEHKDYYEFGNRFSGKQMIPSLEYIVGETLQCSNTKIIPVEYDLGPLHFRSNTFASYDTEVHATLSNRGFLGQIMNWNQDHRFEFE